jgi:sugar lactone lactonase YvrE
MTVTLNGPWGPACALGEGPRWDQARQRLVWVDIDNGLLLEAQLDGTTIGAVTTRPIARTLGAATPTDDGGVLAAAHDRLVLLGADGTRHESRRLVPEGHRFNDGAVDPAGRYLVGTLSLGTTTWDEQLLRLEQDGSVTVLDDDLGLSNGLAWSTDGSRLFSVDSERQVVFVRDYDVATGETGTRAAWAEVRDGFPDGIWMDAEDHLWVAVWGAGVVHRFSPSGDRVSSLPVPAPHTTAITFAGTAHDVMVVTTADTGLNDQQRAACPGSGRLFTTRVPVPGLACTPWSPGPLPL